MVTISRDNFLDIIVYELDKIFLLEKISKDIMRLLVMCIGNRDGGDDGIGPFIADLLEESNREVINAETTPENYTGTIKQYQPDKLVIVDAVDMGLQAGDIRIIPEDAIGEMHISTHGIPLSILIRYLKQYINQVIIIGIQPKTMSGVLSKEVEESGRKLVDLIINDEIDKIKQLNKK